MKLVLCSEGFRTEHTVKACVDLVGKPQQDITVAIINEAYAVEEGDKRWVLRNLNDVAQNFTAKIDLINLLALPIEQIEARITQCDVIYVVGGNADYLMHVFKKSGFADMLPDLLKTKVYVGSSAGSMVMGKKISPTAYYDVYGRHEKFEGNAYLELVDFALMPHMNAPAWTNCTPEKLDTLMRDSHFPAYGLQDDAAIIVNDNTVSFVGSVPHEVGCKILSLPHMQST